MPAEAAPIEPWRSFLADLMDFSRDRSKHVTIATPPAKYASRLIRMFPSVPWKRLRLFGLDATDIALSKLERNAERDREDFLRLARAGHIDPHVLKERYYEELRPYLLSRLSWHDKTLELWLEMAWPAT